MLTNRGERLPVTSVDGLSWAKVSFKCAGSFSLHSASSASSNEMPCKDSSYEVEAG